MFVHFHFHGANCSRLLGWIYSDDNQHIHTGIHITNLHSGFLTMKETQYRLY